MDDPPLSHFTANHLNLDAHFPRYVGFDPLVPVWCVTPDRGRTIHRFFDTSPFSASGRYLGLTRLPYEDRLPQPGDVAEILVVDLHTGEERIVAETRGWDTQLGAQVQWGADDTELYFNDVDERTWEAAGVKLNPATGEKRVLEGPIYMVSPDGRWAASPDLVRIGATQPGYGIIVPPDHVRRKVPPTEDGIYVTSTETGRSRLLVSLAQVVDEAGPTLRLDARATGELYCFHVKWSPRGDRLLFVLRWLAHDPGAPVRMRAQLLTLSADGSDIRVAIPASEWGKGGHHPNWCPDGEHVLMNLRLDGTNMRFACARYDGGGLRELVPGITGSGHPTLHPNGRQLLTDAYPREPVAFGDGTVPIRLVDVAARTEKLIVRVPCVPAFSGPREALRVDLHPAWDRNFSRIAFNAWLAGSRRVCVADLSGELSSSPA